MPHQSLNGLIEIDLDRTNRDGGAGLEPGPRYVVLIGGQFHKGWFTRQWYGLNFQGGPWSTGLQYDPPGENCTMWQKVWLIRDPRMNRKTAQECLRMAGLDPYRVATELEQEYAVARRRMMAETRVSINGVRVTEDMPLEGFTYVPTWKPPIPDNYNLD